jgi:hypothetical protein
MTKPALQSTRHTLPDDPVAVWEYFYERGWCDGLPIIPPTPERVVAMLQGVERDPQNIVARLSPSHAEVTVEKVAVSAVMAGCRTGSLPVLIAAVEGIAEPRFLLLPMGTPPATPLMILNGPIRHELGINCGYSALGGVTRSNATLGRALRLVTLSIGLGGTAAIADQATHGLPTRISFCLGENEEASPWGPLHVARGFRKGDSAVTVVNVVSPINIVDQDAKSADSLLTTLAGSMTTQGSNNMSHNPGEPFLMLGLNHARMLASEGLSKRDVQERLRERAFVPFDSFSPDLQESMRKGGRLVEDGRVHVVREPEDLQVFVAGGLGPHSQFFTTLGRPATRLVSTKSRP